MLITGDNGGKLGTPASKVDLISTLGARKILSPTTQYPVSAQKDLIKFTCSPPDNLLTRLGLLTGLLTVNYQSINTGGVANVIISRIYQVTIASVAGSNMSGKIGLISPAGMDTLNGSTLTLAVDNAGATPFLITIKATFKLTLGCGRNLTDVGITREESMVLMATNIAGTVRDLDRNLPWWRQMNDARQNVLANMCFNMGIGKLLGFKNTLAMMQAGRYDAAAAGMLDSLWANQVHDRAKRLAARMRTGEFA